jgi:hypothetical protein
VNGSKRLEVVVALIFALGGLPAMGQAAAPQEASSPQGEIISRPYPITEEASAGRTGPILLEHLGGALAGSVGLGVGLAMIALGPGDCDGAPCYLGPASLIAIGGTIFTPLGVWGAGSLLGGRGRFLPTLGGFALGSLAGLGVGALTYKTPVIALAILMPITGAVVGYELSHASQVSAAKVKQESASVRVMPMVGPSPTGGLIGGLVGQF